MKPKNIKEAQELAERYETITLDEIKEEWGEGWVAENLTGFGDVSTCALCLPIDDDCDVCIYDGYCMCGQGPNEETYDRIDQAKTPTKLKNAFRARAKHIRGVLKQWE